MIKNLYAVFDKKAEVFCQPYVSQNDSTAIRDFEHAATDDHMDIGRYPADFDLYFLGVFDDQLGTISTEGMRHFLANASQFIKLES